MPGVHAVLTHRDVPAVRIDADLLPLDEIVRFVGDEVAVVAAESETLAEDALRLIRVEYEVLPASLMLRRRCAQTPPVCTRRGT